MLIVSSESAEPQPNILKSTLSLSSLPSRIGVPQRRCSLLRLCKFSVSKQLLLLSREELSHSFQRSLAEGTIFGSTLTLQRRKHGSREVER